jgi:hypothetical protein
VIQRLWSLNKDMWSTSIANTCFFTFPATLLLCAAPGRAETELKGGHTTSLPADTSLGLMVDLLLPLISRNNLKDSRSAAL